MLGRGKRDAGAAGMRSADGVGAQAPGAQGADAADKQSAVDPDGLATKAPGAEGAQAAEGGGIVGGSGRVAAAVPAADEVARAARGPQDAGTAQGAAVGKRGKLPKGGKRTGTRMGTARKLTLAAVFVAVIVSLAFDSGLGTPSSFGIGEFFLLCPLGGLEAMVASKSFIPVSAISMGVVLVLSLVFGRAWCAWGCPAPVIRRFFKRDPKWRGRKAAAAAQGGADGGPVAGAADAGQPAAAGAQPAAAGGCKAACGAWSLVGALKFLARDSRTWSLLIVLVAVAVAGIPLFCLVCPIGLTYGTVGSLWHLIVDKQMTASVLVFPAALAVELVACRTWCVNLCPVAGLLGIVGQFAHHFRPQVNAETCITRNGTGSCDRCMAVCSERIDLHASDTPVQLGQCTRCGECAKHCPTASIDFKV